MNNKQGIKGAARLLRAQLIVMMVVSFMTLMHFGLMASLSIILGGLVSALPNANFARMLFRYGGARSAKKIVNSLYKGEAMKILLTASLFAVIFKYFALIPLAFMTGFIVVQMVFWFAPLIFDNQQK